MESIKRCGDRIRSRRLEKQFTLEDVSEYTKLSLAYLSKVERGLTSPTLDNLSQIAAALSTTVTELINVREEREIVRGPEMYRREYPELNQVTYTINIGDQTDYYEYIVVEPGPAADDWSVHPFDEVVTVFEGELTIVLDDAETRLMPGDTMLVRSGKHHAMRNDGSVRSVSFWHHNTPYRYLG